MSIKESIALHLECMDEVQDERFLRQILTLLLKHKNSTVEFFGENRCYLGSGDT